MSERVGLLFFFFFSPFGGEEWARLPLAPLGLLTWKWSPERMSLLLAAGGRVGVRGGEALSGSVSACFCSPYPALGKDKRSSAQPNRPSPGGQCPLSAYAKESCCLAAENWRKAAGHLPRPCTASSGKLESQEGEQMIQMTQSLRHHTPRLRGTAGEDGDIPAGAVVMGAANAIGRRQRGVFGGLPRRSAAF